ncbi:hypothetical protein EHS25_003602 [Saitozyma podzolica]|uniref:Haloacid dehalogenase-like hydrolase domain-containing protein 3 n=1 Tax=Saitozyma podzolica TaxID=1890683 RepID=A0A427Y7P1_9TREE|nr:hypothetical protein EHS25_003602 [Saitozyma podzolica]
MSHARGKTPVRLVLFDVFDTLCTPRLPIHEQYHEEAIRAGISPSSISPESVRQGFKPAFKEMERQFPLYGKLAKPPVSPEAWWAELIRRCMLHAGASQSDVDTATGLGESLLTRFESDHGYRDFDDTLRCLQALKDLGIKISVVSNADPRILKTLDSLNILPLLTCPPTLSWDVEASKPSAEIYQAACRLCGEDIGEGVIMVGDELKADYHGARAAGLEARLIRRDGEWSDGAARRAEEDLKGVEVVRSLDELLDEVRHRAGSS